MCCIWLWWHLCFLFQPKVLVIIHLASIHFWSLSLFSCPQQTVYWTPGPTQRRLFIPRLLFFPSGTKGRHDKCNIAGCNQFIKVLFFFKVNVLLNSSFWSWIQRLMYHQDLCTQMLYMTVMDCMWFLELTTAAWWFICCVMVWNATSAFFF